MLRRLLDFFAADNASAQTTAEERVRVATCVLLLEIAAADSSFSKEERDTILQTLQTRYALTGDEAEELLQTAVQFRSGSVDYFAFTRQINEFCSVPEKEQIMEEIWRVIYADGLLDAHEDYLVHKFGRLLNLSHPQLIRAKMKVLAKFRSRPS